MKILKVISSVLVAVMLACTFISCNNGTGNEEGTTGESVSDISVTVSLKIKDKDGKIIEEATDYVYTGPKATVFNILEDYCTIEKGIEFVAENGTVKTIGEYSADSEYYWAFWKGTANDGSVVDNQTMSEFEIADGEGFTVFLRPLAGD